MTSQLRRQVHNIGRRRAWVIWLVGLSVYGLAVFHRTSLGVAGVRMRSISYGEERPQCTSATESCWAMNRRAHFIVTGRTNAG